MKPKPKRRARSRPPPASGGSAGKDGETPQAPQKPDVKDVPCYFHSAAKYGQGNGCLKGAACSFSHARFMTKAAFQAEQRPRSTSATKRPGRGSGNGKSAHQPKKSKLPYHCNKFLKDGACSGKNCRYPHLTKVEYEAELVRIKAAETAESGQ